MTICVAWGRRRLGILGMALALTLTLPFAGVRPALAGMAEPAKYKPGNIIVAFEGGVVGEDVGAVLLSLAKDENLLFTTPHVIAAGDSPCAVMIGRGYPRPCSAKLLQTLDILNPGMKPSRGRLKVGQTLQVPDVWLRTYKTARSFNNNVETEKARSAAIKNSWSHLQAQVVQSTPRSEQVEFDAYELIFTTPDEARQKRLLERINPYRTANVRVTPIGFQSLQTKVYSSEMSDPGLYQQECQQVRTPPAPPRKIDYRSYADMDGDLVELVRERPANARPAKVYLIDVKLNETPNLIGAIEGSVVTPGAPGTTTAWQCAWAGAASKAQHATHLAGIIASRDNGFGFVGVSPSSRIVPYEFIQPSATSSTALDIPPERVPWLADAINDNRSNTDPYLYLVANNFPDFDASQLSHGTVPKEERVSNARPIENRINDLRPLFIVAAGQVGPAEQPVALNPTVPMSPQNLGDLRNVLVVTACEICSRTAPVLMASANYAADGKAVQVAAPGGSPILGWIAGTGIGVDRGTSQAAAFTAGVAAEMIGRWPENYRDADYVKRRIQVTSWPLYARPGNTDYTRIATGLVDPLLALLDPRQTWVHDANGWRAIRFKGLSDAKPSFLTPANEELVMPVKSIARIVRINDTGPAKWVVYRTAGLGEVVRDGPVTPAAVNLAVLTCSGEQIPLSDIKDLLLTNSRSTDVPCAP